MARFKLICEQIETGRKARFFYDNLHSTLTDESGNAVVIPEALAIPQQQSTTDISFPATSRETPNDKTKAIRTLKIQLGLHCNYDCRYCNQRQSLMQGDALTTPTNIAPFLEQLPSWFDGGPDGQGQDVKIEFWGGEPFVYWKTLQPLAEALRKRYPNANFLVITNGSLLTIEKNDWLVRLGFAVAISHDGPGYHVRGADPLDDPQQREIILDLYNKLSPLGRISINAMLHRDNASRAEIQNWLVQRFGEDVAIGEGTFIDPYDEGGVAQSMPNRSWAQSYAKQAFLELRAGMANKLSVVQHKVQDFIDAIVNRRSANVLGQKCGMDRDDSIAVDLKGNVLTCQNASAKAIAPNGESHRIGHISDFANIKLNTSTHWSYRTECPTCPLLQLCKGACMFLEGPLWEQGCNNAFADNLPFFAMGVEILTGFVPVYIEGPQRADRQDVFGFSATPSPSASSTHKIIPISPAYSSSSSKVEREGERVETRQCK